MYRTVARRLLAGVTASTHSKSHLRLLKLQTGVNSRFCTSVNSPPPSTSNTQNPNLEHIPPIVVRNPAQSESDSTSQQRHQKKRVNGSYEEEQARVLQASLRHVLRLGWSEEAMIAGARDVGVSPSIVGSFRRKEAALVEFFMDECLQKLMDRIGSGENYQDLVPSERISKLIKIRLEMQAPYISKWPQALSIQAFPANLPTSFKQRAMVIDEIWHAAGEDSFDMDWYVKRTVLGGIYSTTEIYMLTDSSPDFRDTWAFLDNRVKDAFDLKKTVQEARYLAEAVGAGMGSSLQGFMKKVMQV